MPSAGVAWLSGDQGMGQQGRSDEMTGAGRGWREEGAGSVAGRETTCWREGERLAGVHLHLLDLGSRSWFL